MPRHILHIDMNAFYCACHAADEPERYASRPTAVAGSPQTRHGVVVTASYEARARGVKATMTVAEALRACPSLILIHPDFDLYRSYSKRVFEIVGNYTPLVEIFSIDECWADITGSGQFGEPLEIAACIQSRLQEQLGLPCSIGIGPNKLLAKMASDFKKPLGITELWTEQVPKLLWPMPVSHLFGIGQKTAERLQRLGFQTIGDLAAADPERLVSYFGKRGQDMIHHANGMADDVVNATPAPLQSIGHSITLSEDISDMESLFTVLMNLSDQVGRRVRRHQLKGRTVQLTIRYGSRETVTRSKTLVESTDLTEVIYQTAKDLLMQHRKPIAVRLLGVSLAGLSNEDVQDDTIQLSLFETVAPDVVQERRRKLAEVTDALRNRFGEDAVIRGRMLQSHESGQIRNRKIRGTSLQKDELQ